MYDTVTVLIMFCCHSALYHEFRHFSNYALCNPSFSFTAATSETMFYIFDISILLTKVCERVKKYNFLKRNNAACSQEPVLARQQLLKFCTSLFEYSVFVALGAIVTFLTTVVYHACICCGK